MSGSIMLSSPIPEAKPSEYTTTFGFSPQSAGHPGPWLLILRNERLVQLMEGEQVVQSTSGRGIENLTPGIFQLLHKQRRALWYAPDSYFAARRLKIPPEGDRSRLLRGALGEFALFLNKETPLHSGPLWIREIGGIQLDDNALSKIYYTLPIGAPIEVR